MKCGRAGVNDKSMDNGSSIVDQLKKEIIESSCNYDK